MLEYVFFSDKFRQLFVDYLTTQKVHYTCSKDPIEDTLLLSIEEPDDDLWDTIDAKYDALNEQDQAAMELEADSVGGAGIYIGLKGGAKTLATVNPDVMNRILSMISMEEFNDFVETIVHSVEEPDDSPICQQLEQNQEN